MMRFESRLLSASRSTAHDVRVPLPLGYMGRSHTRLRSFTRVNSPSVRFNIVIACFFS